MTNCVLIVSTIYSAHMIKSANYLGYFWKKSSHHMSIVLFHKYLPTKCTLKSWNSLIALSNKYKVHMSSKEFMGCQQKVPESRWNKGGRSFIWWFIRFSFQPWIKVFPYRFKQMRGNDTIFKSKNEKEHSIFVVKSRWNFQIRKL